MMIWRCDNCGHEAKSDQIVGREFDYSKNGGFGSLVRAVDGKRDLCKKCMNAAESAFRSAKQPVNPSWWTSVAQALKVV